MQFRLFFSQKYPQFLSVFSQNRSLLETVIYFENVSDTSSKFQMSVKLSRKTPRDLFCVTGGSQFSQAQKEKNCFLSQPNT